MANSKISALTSATTPLAGTETLPIVQSSATKQVATNDLTVRNVRAAATTGILQVSGPTAGTTRTMTVPDANFTAARTDSAQTFSGLQTFGSGVSVTSGKVTSVYGAGGDFVAVFQNTSSATPYGVWIKDASGPAAGYPLLNISDSTGVTTYFRVDSSNGNQTLGIGNLVIGTSGKGVTTGSAIPLGFGTNGSTTQAKIDTSGNFYVVATSQINSGLVSFLANSGGSYVANGLGIQDGANGSGFQFASFNNAGGTQIGSITRVTTTNAVVYNTTSDQRLKSNIEDAAPVLDKLMQVQVRQYDWTDGDLHQDYGFVAQELEPLLSGVVTKGKTEKDVWQLDYSRLTPHLIKAMQEQQAIITQQSEIINTLTARVVALESK
jgi:hypothetical protein